MTEHDKIRSMLAAYCSDDLSRHERETVRAHLEGCPDCRLELADLETTVRLIKSQPPVESPPWLTGRIMARVREEAAPPRPRWSRWFLPLHIKLPLEALAVVLVCLLGYSFFRETGQQSLSPLPRVPAPAAIEEKAPSSAAVSPQSETRKAARQPLQAPGAGAARRSAESDGGEGAVLPSPPRPQAAVKDEETLPRGLDSATTRPAAEPSLAAGLAPQPRQYFLAVAEPAAAEAAIREAVVSSGGLVSGHPSPRCLSIHLDADRLAELLERLAMLGRLTGPSDAAVSEGSVELTLCW